MYNRWRGWPSKGRGNYIYPVARRINSSKEVGKFLSFCSIFILIYLYSDWQVCVIRRVVGFSASNWVNLLFEYVHLCAAVMSFLFLCVWLYAWMILSFIMVSNLIENVIGLTRCLLQIWLPVHFFLTCSCHLMLQEDGNVDFW